MQNFLIKLFKIILDIILITLVWCLIIFVMGEISLRVYKHFNQESLSAVGTKIFKSDPHNTYAHKPFSAEHNGYGEPVPKIYINNLGFRDKDFIPNKHQNNILMLGDSFTFGTGLSNADIFAEKLEQKLKNEGNIQESDIKDKFDNKLSTQINPKYLKNTDSWQVWNAGVIGYSIDNYLIALKKTHLNYFKPDLVIVNVFVANDITELRRRQWDRDENNELVRVRDQKLIVNNEAQLENRATKKPLSYFAYFLDQRLEVLKLKLGYLDPRSHEPTLTWPVFLDKNHPGSDLRLDGFWERFFVIQDEMVEYGKQNDIPIVFNLLPMDVQVDDVYRSKYTHPYFDDEAKKADRPQTKILDYCKNKNYNCLDTLPVLRSANNTDKLFFSHNADPHFDVWGHEVVAEFLFDALKDILKNQGRP